MKNSGQIFALVLAIGASSLIAYSVGRKTAQSPQDEDVSAVEPIQVTRSRDVPDVSAIPKLEETTSSLARDAAPKTLKQAEETIAELESQMKEILMVMQHDVDPATLEDIMAMKELVARIEQELDAATLRALRGSASYRELHQLIRSLPHQSF